MIKKIGFYIFISLLSFFVIFEFVNNNFENSLGLNRLKHYYNNDLQIMTKASKNFSF